jgi:hypothetical protein
MSGSGCSGRPEKRRGPLQRGDIAWVDRERVNDEDRGVGLFSCNKQVFTPERQTQQHSQLA